MDGLKLAVGRLWKNSDGDIFKCTRVLKDTNPKLLALVACDTAGKMHDEKAEVAYLEDGQKFSNSGSKTVLPDDIVSEHIATKY